ncbi:MAG: response regulator transcription factor [Proteobacteria bacterium]|nr:response regulator transcription factor [Pseudomonadota bacterium]
MRCLVIDDDESPRALVAAVLRRHGHESAGVENGDQAIAAMDSGEFDFAIVDMELPGTDGATLTAELRGRYPDLKVLIVSGHDDRRYILSALEAGANGYLLKDDVGEFLPAALHDIEAGFTLLSPRIHTGTLRKLLRVLGRPVVEARSEPRSRSDLKPVQPPA